MTDDRAGNLPNNPPISVSPDNPCPFLRAVVAEGYVGGHNVPLGTLAQHREGRERRDGIEEAESRHRHQAGRADRQRAQSAAADQELVVGRHARRAARRSARQARRRLAHPRCERPRRRRRDRAPRLLRQGPPQPDGRRPRARPDQQRNHHLHGCQFRARQEPSQGNRPQVDGRRVAGAVAHHGQGRRRRTLSQRCRGKNAVHRAPAAGPHQCAVVGASGARQRIARQGRQGRCRCSCAGRSVHLCVRRVP